MEEAYPMRINKYLAHKNYCTRRAADELISGGKVLINGRRAQLGDKVQESDKVEVRFRAKKYAYYAYHKPRGIATHSSGEHESDIKETFPVKGVFPIGRLDKDSHGLIILTDDGRITDKLLNPEFEHEKEYVVKTQEALREGFPARMARGVDIGLPGQGLPGQGGYVTKPCKVRSLGPKSFSIVLSEGKKHQIRRMCAALGATVVELKRVRILNVRLGDLKEGAHRAIEGTELVRFLKELGL